LLLAVYLARNESRSVRAWCAGETRRKGCSKMNDAETILKAVLTADGDRCARALKVLETGTVDAIPEPLLTTNQVCERLQVSRATLWRWRFPCVRRGGVRRYRWHEVMTALEKTKAADAQAADGTRK
jgi:predicted DNA-binding transcriptional regulator AlpA